MPKHKLVYSGFQSSTVHLRAEEDSTLENFLAIAITDYTQRKRLFELGAIYLNHSRVRYRHTVVRNGDYLRIHCRPRRFSGFQEISKEHLIFDNQNFIVVNKPRELPTHATLDNDLENAQRFFEKHLKQSLWVTHRLDQDTVGLLVFAKNKDFAQRFHQALADHQVEKRYYLLCQKSIPLGRHRHFMLRSPRAPKNVYQHEPTGVDSLNCELEVLSCKAQNEDIYAVEIRLLTGRTHQIRSQLAALGAPILGDRLYGSSVSLNKGFALQCYRLDFFKQSFTLPKEEFLKNLKFVAEEIIS